MKVIFSGGGTLGSVSPLVAMIEEMKVQGYTGEFLWVGTKNGPEVQFVHDYGIRYVPIPAGKWRRYFSIRNIFDPLMVASGFIRSFFLLLKEKPDAVVSAGAFVSVPLVWAAGLLRIPVLIHQQDVQVGLANKLMARTARVITVTFEKSAEFFERKKVVVTGNPFREGLRQADKARAYEVFGFRPDVPVVLVLGGGTGARAINDLIINGLEELVGFTQVIHSTGHGKTQMLAQHSRYRGFEFLEKNTLGLALSIADLVVSRAGLSTITELSQLGKATLFIPIPQSHQEDNVQELSRLNACEVVSQIGLDSKSLVAIIQDLVNDKPLLHTMEKNITRVMPSDATKRVVYALSTIMK